MLLHAQLSFYPDARRTDSVHVATVLFGRANDGWVFAHYLIPQAIEKAQGLVMTEGLSRLLSTLGEYLQRQAGGIKIHPEYTEEQYASELVSHFPENLRMSEPAPWPPEQFTAFIEESGHIGAGCVVSEVIGSTRRELVAV